MSPSIREQMIADIAGLVEHVLPDLLTDPRIPVWLVKKSIAAAMYQSFFAGGCTAVEWEAYVRKILDEAIDSALAARGQVC